MKPVEEGAKKKDNCIGAC